MTRTTKFKKGLLSFLIFIIVILKDLLVGYFKIIPERGIANRTISWFIILPLALYGCWLSIKIIRENYQNMKAHQKRFIDINLLLSLPILAIVVYSAVTLFYLVIFRT